MAPVRQIQRGRPATEPITAKYQNAHFSNDSYHVPPSIWAAHGLCRRDRRPASSIAGPAALRQAWFSSLRPRRRLGGRGRVRDGWTGQVEPAGRKSGATASQRRLVGVSGDRPQTTLTPSAREHKSAVAERQTVPLSREWVRLVSNRRRGLEGRATVAGSQPADWMGAAGFEPATSRV